MSGSAFRSAGVSLGRQQQLSRDSLHVLQTVHERFARAITRQLSTELSSNLSASVASIDSIPSVEVVHLLSSPAVLAVIEVPELDGNIALELDPAMALAFIDRLLGGRGQSLPQARALTEIEQRLIARILTKWCAELGTAWSSISSLSFKLQSIEADLELARSVDANEMVWVVALEIHMNEIVGALRWFLPHAVLQPAFDRSSVARSSTTAGAALPLATLVEPAFESRPIDIEVDLARLNLSLRELLDLEQGSVLSLGPAGESRACASLPDGSRLEGRLSMSRGMRAFQVLSRSFDRRPADENP